MVEDHKNIAKGYTWFLNGPVSPQSLHALHADWSGVQVLKAAIGYLCLGEY